MSKSKLEEYLADDDNWREFIKESLADDATELVAELMDREGISRSDLAKRIGKSRSYVTQTLAGNRNMTLHTLADLTFAMGYKVEINAVRLHKQEEQHTAQYAASVSQIYPLPPSNLTVGQPQGLARPVAA